MPILVGFSPSSAEFIQPEVHFVVFWEVYSLGHHVGFSVGRSRQKVTLLPQPDPL